MTDTQTETTAPALTMDSLDTFQRMFAEQLVTQIEAHNALVAKIKASSSNLDDVMDSLKAGDDPKVRKAVEKMEALDAEREKIATSLNEYVKAEAEKVLASQKETDTSGIDEERKALSAKISQGVSYLAAETKVDKKDLPLPKVATLRGMSSGEGNGTGGRRLRGFTVTVEGKDHTSFSSAAGALEIPTPDLQAHYFKAAGTEDAEKFPARVEFTVNGKNVVAYRVEAGAATARQGNTPAA
jgi:hypothetical protein